MGRLYGTARWHNVAMCCFSRPVDSVSSTNIFARPLGNARQALIYQMAYVSREALAMVLPLPVAANSGENALAFVDLSGSRDLFTQLAAGFPEPIAAGRSRTVAPTPEPLAVVEVGDFIASFVPSPADFSRLDDRFRLSPDIWAALPAYATYGFAVVQLKEGKKRIHPLGLTFPTAMPTRLFFPTLHIHGSDVPKRARFDHVLYAQPTEGVPAPRGWDESPQLVRQYMDVAPTAGLIRPDTHLYRLRILGVERENADIIV